MPISRNQANNILHWLTFDFPDITETLKVGYAPNLVTPEFQRMVRRSSSQVLARRSKWEKRRAEALAALKDDEELPADLADDSALEREEQQHQLTLLTTVIKRWDLWEYDPTPEDPDPPKLPITFETLESLGWPLLNRIGREIAAANDVDPTKSRSTAPGSEVTPTNMAAISRNGAS